MMTNLLATIVISIVTNVSSPTQYYYSDGIVLGNGWSAGPEWRDHAPYNYGTLQAKTRANPDVVDYEVHETETITFEYKGQPISILTRRTVLDKWRKRRVVHTNEEWVDEN